MAAGDVVSPHIDTVSPASMQMQPPHFGKITAHGAPGTPTILWDTALTVTLAGAALADLGLDVIETAETDTLDEFTGKMALSIAPSGATATDSAGGTSREFVGTVVSIYKRTPAEDSPGSGDDYLLVKSGDAYFEDLATQFTPVI